MSDKKPEPLVRPQAQKKCPVCGYPSYSIDGVHPQCHGVKADRKRRELLVAKARADSLEAEANKKNEASTTETR